jgi:large subunit ribosomal protein L27
MILTGSSSLLRRTAAAAARAPTSQAPASLAIASTSVAASSTILPAFAFGGSIQTRNSTKRGGGSTKNNRNSPGKRLGYKKQTGTFPLPSTCLTSLHLGRRH